MGNQVGKPCYPEGLANIQGITHIHCRVKVAGLYIKKQITMRTVKIYFVGETVRTSLKHIAPPAARTFTFKHSP
jgi:hypothetical protein